MFPVNNIKYQIWRLATCLEALITFWLLKSNYFDQVVGRASSMVTNGQAHLKMSVLGKMINLLIKTGPHETPETWITAKFMVVGTAHVYVSLSAHCHTPQFLLVVGKLILLRWSRSIFKTHLDPHNFLNIWSFWFSNE